MPIVSNPFGTPGGDQATYTIADVAVAADIAAAKFTEIGVAVNAERSRRSAGAQSYTFVGSVDAAELNALVSGVDSAGYTSGFGVVSISDDITALNVNQMIDKVQASGNVCLCNCNYCACNCNFCSCNCNHSCTCNCNYSDETIKMDIIYL